MCIRDRGNTGDSKRKMNAGHSFRFIAPLPPPPLVFSNVHRVDVRVEYDGLKNTEHESRIKNIQTTRRVAERFNVKNAVDLASYVWTWYGSSQTSLKARQPELAYKPMQNDGQWECRVNPPRDYSQGMYFVCPGVKWETTAVTVACPEGSSECNMWCEMSWEVYRCYDQKMKGNFSDVGQMTI